MTNTLMSTSVRFMSIIRSKQSHAKDKIRVQRTFRVRPRRGSVRVAVPMLLEPRFSASSTFCPRRTIGAMRVPAARLLVRTVFNYQRPFCTGMPFFNRERTVQRACLPRWYRRVPSLTCLASCRLQIVGVTVRDEASSSFSDPFWIVRIFWREHHPTQDWRRIRGD